MLHDDYIIFWYTKLLVKKSKNPVTLKSDKSGRT